jgi:hypothetical protein
MKEQVHLGALECEAVARGALRVAQLRMSSGSEESNKLLADIDALLTSSIEHCNGGAFLAAATDAVDAAACALIFATALCLMADNVPRKEEMN